MKLILVLMVCALAAAAPKVETPQRPLTLESSPDRSNLLINILIKQMFDYLRFIINNGSLLFRFPPLDPLVLDHAHLVIPAGLINLDLELTKVFGTGIGGFVVHRSHANLHDLTLDLDISVPRIFASADEYSLIGDFLTAIPLYGNGKAVFKLEDFRFQAKLFINQSEDGKSAIIEKIENVSFQIPVFKSELTGAIGGGDIDGIVNAMIEDVIIDYVNRFQGAIGIAAAKGVQKVLNPILEQLDTWRYIAVLLP